MGNIRNIKKYYEKYYKKYYVKYEAKTCDGVVTLDV